MFCFHKYGKVESDGYQYCKKCGKAIVPPCQHEWEDTTSFILLHPRDFKTEVGKKYIQHCKHCKDMREFVFVSRF